MEMMESCIPGASEIVDISKLKPQWASPRRGEGGLGREQANSMHVIARKLLRPVTDIMPHNMNDIHAVYIIKQPITTRYALHRCVDFI